MVNLTLIHTSLTLGDTGIVLCTASSADWTERMICRLRNLPPDGYMLAMLDSWDHPAYLTHIWTIYEQFQAHKLDVKVKMILPPDEHRNLHSMFEEGKVGLQRLVQSVRDIDVSNTRPRILKTS